MRREEGRGKRESDSLEREREREGNKLMSRIIKFVVMRIGEL